MARRRSRRRKSSYSDQPKVDGLPADVVVGDLSHRARRLVESGVIDLAAIAGSGDGGRITSGDILHAARVMEVEQSVARIETVARSDGDSTDESENAPLSPFDPPMPAADVEPESVAHKSDAPEPAAEEQATEEQATEEQATEEQATEEQATEEQAIEEPESEESGGDPTPPVAEITDSATTSAAKVGGDPVKVADDPWNAYNGTSEGLSESALPGAEQSWGEAEANIAAMAEEAAAQIDGDAGQLIEEPGHAEPVDDDLAAESPVEPDAVPDVEPVEQPAAVVASLDDIEAAVDPVPEPAEAPAEGDIPAAAVPVGEQVLDQREVMMDFGTLEMVDPESVWAEGAEDFAPWFLAHSRQLGDVLGMEAGLAEARQFTTKSATGVVGRDDKGEDVVVVSSQNAEADDSDLGRALGMAASSGAATVALVSAKFNEEQLQALSWLNNQTKSGVQWYGIEMRVVRIADSPAAMLFDLVASPPNPE